MQNHGGLPSQKIVLAEIHAITIALRTNSRFATPARFKYEVTRSNEKKLMLNLKDLRERASSKIGWQSLSLLEILSPFFEIIVSEDTTGPITGVALQSIQKFLEHPCITIETQGVKIAMEEIVKTVKHCQFEVTDAVTDEAVLIKILQVFCSCIRCNAGALLTENQVLEIMKSCFRIGRETRPTELLRRYAENSLQEITEVVFRRAREGLWKEMPKVYEFICDLCDPEKEGKSASLRLLGLTLGNTVLEIMGQNITQFTLLADLAKNNFARALLRNSTTSNIVVLSETLRGMQNLITCAAPLIHEQIEAFLISTHLRIADSKQSPSEHQELVLESLIDLCSDPNFVFFIYKHYDCSDYSTNLFEGICSFLSKNIKESESLNTLHILSFHGLFSIVRCIAEKTQQFNGLSQNETLEQSKKFESIRNLKESKKKMMDIAIKFNQDPKKGIKALEELYESKISPKQTAIFLRNYANWLSKDAIGECLREKGDFFEKVLEEYMNSFDFSGLTIERALRYVVNEFKLQGEGFQIEKMLKYFAYSYYNCNQNATILKDAETTWIFAVAVLMLHTDLHSVNNRNKMTVEQWINNTSYINAPEGIPREDLENIYNDILKEEFHFSTNFYEAYKSEFVWNNFLKKSSEYFNSKKPIYHCNDIGISNVNGEDTATTIIPKSGDELPNTNGSTCSTHQNSCIEEMDDDIAYGGDLFLRMWGNAILATSVVLENTEDENILQTAIKGYIDCAKIAGNLRLSNVFDNLVISLCSFTKVLDPNHDNSVVQFGNNEKYQFAARTVFAITRSFGDNLREGWKNILDLILRMYDLDLLPENVIYKEVFEGSSNISQKKKRKKPSVNYSSGMTSIFSSFFNTSDDTLLQKQATEKAQKCVEQCHIAEMLSDAKFLSENSLEYLVKALIVSCNSSISAMNENSSNSASHLDHQRSDMYGQEDPYEENSYFNENEARINSYMFCLDLMIDIMITNKDKSERIGLIWRYVYDYMKPKLSFVVSKWNESVKSNKKVSLRYTNKIMIERICVSILKLSIRLLLIKDSSTREKLFQTLELFNMIPDELMIYVLPPLCTGVISLVKAHSKNIKNGSVWELILRILRLAHTDKGAIRAKATESMCSIVTEGAFLWPDNIIACVHTLITLYPANVVDLMYSLHTRMFSFAPTLSNPSPLWTRSWLYILEGIASLCTSTDRESRNRALVTIQRILLDRQLLNLPSQLLDLCLTKIVFFLMDELVQKSKKDNRIDKPSIEEARLRVANLLAKSFLHYLPNITQIKEFDSIWAKVLKYMQQYMYIPDSDLAEAVPELLKNMILVMNAQGVFTSRKDIWEQTKLHLNAFIPSLSEELNSKFQNETKEMETNQKQQEHLQESNQSQSVKSPVEEKSS